jgi:glycine cleavage system aminomethyltransferase T
MRDIEIHAVRTGVAFCAEPTMVCLRVSGDDAFPTLDRVCAADLFVRDGQVRPSVLLDEQGRVFADVYVGQDDDALLLMSEGPSAAQLTEHLRAHAPSGASLTIEELTASHDLLSVHGPYAWELIGELLGPDLIGLPYLYFYRTEGILCLRGGKTGEYGYDLFIPRDHTGEIRERLEVKGSAFDLRQVGLEALSQCSLENGFFDIRREGRHGLTPIELGLQWRVSYRKDHVGAPVLAAQRAAGVARRATYLVAQGPIAEDDAVELDGERIGHVLSAGASPILKTHVGVALLDRPFFHAGIDRFTAAGAGERVHVLTVSPPVLVNRSLYINPQRHSYATRARDNFPPLV